MNTDLDVVAEQVFQNASGRVSQAARPEGSFSPPQKKGEIIYIGQSNNPYKKKEMEAIKTPYRLNSGSLSADHLIRAATLVRTRGEMCQLDADPTVEETIGILVNKMRRKKKIPLDQFSTNIGFSIEEIIAFEAGLLPKDKLCKMLPVILSTLGINMGQIKKAICHEDHTSDN